MHGVFKRQRDIEGMRPFEKYAAHVLLVECTMIEIVNTAVLYPRCIFVTTLIGQVNYGKIPIHKTQFFNRPPCGVVLLLNLADKTIYQSLLTENFLQYKHISPEITTD